MAQDKLIRKTQWRRRLLSFLAPGVALMLLSAACGEIAQGGGETAKPIVLTKSQQAVGAVGNQFALDFLRVTTEAFPGQDVFLSPMSAAMLCCMLANGAEGETYDEIVKAIGMGGFKLEQVNDYYATMVEALQKVDRSVALSLANSIWIAQGLPVRKDFQNKMDKVYDADIYGDVDFTASSTLKKLNDWCSAKTQGLIPQMFEELDPQVQMILINALYFKGNWTVQFPKENTSQGYFTTTTGSTVKADFMYASSESYTGYLDENVVVVRMPYGNGAFQMEAIMPLGKDFAKFIAGLCVEDLVRYDWNNTEQMIAVRYPKFKAKFDTDKQLVPIMMQLGVKRTFSYEAEFGGMSTVPLYVSNMRQKSFVSIDEEGTEAAAVTVAEMRKNGVADGPKVTYMTFDRPFVYLIRETSTGAILFIGTKTK